MQVLQCLLGTGEEPGSQTPAGQQRSWWGQRSPATGHPTAAYQVMMHIDVTASDLIRTHDCLIINHTQGKIPIMKVTLTKKTLYTYKMWQQIAE